MSTEAETKPRRSIRRWLAIGFAVVLLIVVLRSAMDPFNEDGYAEVPHGNHVHYVPADRDPNVPLDAFPTTPPGPGERVMPDGRVVRTE